MLTEFKPGGLDKLSKRMNMSQETPRGQAQGQASVRRDRQGVARQAGRELGSRVSPGGGNQHVGLPSNQGRWGLRVTGGFLDRSPLATLSRASLMEGSGSPTWSGFRRPDGRCDLAADGTAGQREKIQPAERRKVGKEPAEGWAHPLAESEIQGLNIEGQGPAQLNHWGVRRKGHQLQEHRLLPASSGKRGRRSQGWKLLER